MTETATKQAPEPRVMETYSPGAILEFSWGYDQTNIDYFLIVARKGDWLTLVSLGKSQQEERGFMQGVCEPSQEANTGAKPFRRKVCRDREGKEFGCKIKSYGWCSLWDGKPSHWTGYA